MLNFSPSQIVHKIKTKELSAKELVMTLKKHQTDQGDLNAILWENPEALKKAEDIDRGVLSEGQLLGLPLLVKDNFCVKGMKTTAASHILHDFSPPYTAHCIELLEKEGAIILGKTNLDEFAMGSSTEYSAYGPCKNPWKRDHVSGGSSGGSAAAVAARLAPVAIGSDTGGSIRQPASFCGVVGIKPTYGLVSRFGIIAFASSLDQAGTFGRRVEDAAMILRLMVGKDRRDSTNVENPLPNWQERKGELKKTRVGLPKEFFETQLQPEIKDALEELVKDLSSQGCELVELSLPHTPYAIPTYYLIATSEASSNLSRYDGVRYGLRGKDLGPEQGQNFSDLKNFYQLTRSQGFGDEVKRRILLGTFALSAGHYEAFYTKACQVRRLISEDFTQAFEKCDFIIGPVTRQTAFKIGEDSKDSLSMYYNDDLTAPVNLAGLPAMSLPIGLDEKGLPMGLQIIGPAFKDHSMVAFGKHIEEMVNFQEQPHG